MKHQIFCNRSHFSEGRLQNFVSEREDKPCFRETLHCHTFEAKADTDVVVIRVLEVTETQSSVPFAYEVPGI